METLELNHVTIRWISVSQMDNNVYLVTSKETGEQVLIDAANDAAAITELIEAHGTGTVEAVLTTHSHPDHIQALSEIAQKYGAKTMAGLYDVAEIEKQTGLQLDEQLVEEDILEFDGFRLKAIHLRGHTPGSIAYVIRNYPTTSRVVFTGDSLFPGGVGKTNSDHEFTQLFRDVKERLFEVYDDDTVVLPGHGASTTLGAERPHLEEWCKRGW